MESRYEPWAEHYLDYHGLKKCLPQQYKKKDKKKHKHGHSDASSLVPPPPPPLEGVQSMILTPATTTLTDDNDSLRDASYHQPQQRGSISEYSHHSLESQSHLIPHENNMECHRDFEAFLESEVEKIGLFFLHIQGELASDLAVLRKQQQSDQQGNNNDDLYAQYHALAVLMLQLIHFVESNVTGMRKILKKHDKITKGHLLTEFLSKPNTKTTKELKHLWSDMLVHHYEGITALHMTLKVAVAELKKSEKHRPSHHGLQLLSDATSSHPPKPPRPEKLTAIATAPRHQPVNSMPNIILTLEDLADSAKATASMTPHSFEKKKYGSTGVPIASTTTTSHELDVILFKIEAAQRRMHSSSNTFQEMLAAQIVMLDPLMGEVDSMDGDGDDEEGMMLEEEDANKKRRLLLSRFLNLTSTFLYMTNYYVVAPTSGRYAKMLGGNEAMAGIIIGMTPLAALVSTILYSWWTSHSYKVCCYYLFVFEYAHHHAENTVVVFYVNSHFAFSHFLLYRRNSNLLI